MIKTDSKKKTILLSGTTRELVAETASTIRHLLNKIAEIEKADAATAFKILATAMCDSANDLIEKYHIKAEDLSDDDDEEEEDEDDEVEFKTFSERAKAWARGDVDDEDFVDSLTPKETRAMYKFLELMLEDEKEDDD